MTTAEITIEALETLATQLETDDGATRAKLLRMIRAEARILAVREPSKFRSQATACRDEDGHWDSSYPPKQQYCDRTGPRLVQVSDCSTRDLATEGGFYYAWRRVTEDPGLFVARDGAIWGCDEHGTGRLGAFAAHPGDCDVEVELDWSRRDIDEVTTAELSAVEAHMRMLAFPASAASEAA